MSFLFKVYFKGIYKLVLIRIRLGGGGVPVTLLVGEFYMFFYSWAE